MTDTIHYAGPIQTARMRVLAGWAACCSGGRAAHIRARGNHSYDRDDVTCRLCLAVLRRQDEYQTR